MLKGNLEFPLPSVICHLKKRWIMRADQDFYILNYLMVIFVFYLFSFDFQRVKFGKGRPTFDSSTKMFINGFDKTRCIHKDISV